MAPEPLTRSLLAVSVASLALLALCVSGAPPGAPEDVEAALLKAAIEAQDPEDRTRALRARATLRLRGAPVPAELAAAATAAEGWAVSQPPLRIFASRVGEGRVRVGVEDPARAVDRLEVLTIGPEGAARLTRAESEAAGRNEYLVPPGSGARLEVRAVMRIGARTIVLRRLELEASAPGLPQAPKARAAPRALTSAPSTKPPEAHPVRWWWVVAAGIAVTLVGAAVWQETRF